MKVIRCITLKYCCGVRCVACDPVLSGDACVPRTIIYSNLTPLHKDDDDGRTCTTDRATTIKSREKYLEKEFHFLNGRNQPRKSGKYHVLNNTMNIIPCIKLIPCIE